MTKLLSNPAARIAAAILLGLLFGIACPAWARHLYPVGKLFVSVMRWLMLPVMCCSVAHGVASLRGLSHSGAASAKALACFVAVSALGLAAGVAIAALMAPGSGIAPDAPAAPAGATLFHAGDLPTITLFATAFLVGWVLTLCGDAGARARDAIGRAAAFGFGLVRYLVLLAPPVAFAAIAAEVGRHGLVSLFQLARLLFALYAATGVFILAVLAPLARWTGFSVWRFIVRIADEIVLVVGTASSLSALPRLMAKLDEAGSPPDVTRVLVPAGYVFSLGGSAVYVGVALVFVAQAAGIALGPAQYLTMFLVALACLQTASAVNGSAFLTVVSAVALLPGIPQDGLLLLFSIERLMKCRLVGNLLSVGVTSLAAAAWIGRLDRAKAAAWAGSAPGVKAEAARRHAP